MWAPHIPSVFGSLGFRDRAAQVDDRHQGRQLGKLWARTVIRVRGYMW
jgi:hypothetical protein